MLRTKLPRGIPLCIHLMSVSWLVTGLNTGCVSSPGQVTG